MCSNPRSFANILSAFSQNEYLLEPVVIIPLSSNGRIVLSCLVSHSGAGMKSCNRIGPQTGGRIDRCSVLQVLISLCFKFSCFNDQGGGSARDIFRGSGFIYKEYIMSPLTPIINFRHFPSFLASFLHYIFTLKGFHLDLWTL